MRIRIGTRDSPLALWQAQAVAKALEAQGHECSLVAVKSRGDQDLVTPLHQFGSTGIFTKILDEALYRQEVDIAVHSLKDYPTQAPPGILLTAVLERGDHRDILVHKGDLQFLQAEAEGHIATGSIRRRAQWSARYPRHQISGLRGNVQTRLNKLKESDWHGAIFALAGLQRVALLPAEHQVLEWMLPAPAQGAVGITQRSDDQALRAVLASVNHRETWLCTQAERQFLRRVEGGCSAPVGALARIENNKLFLEAGVFSLDGSKSLRVEKELPLSQADELGILAGAMAMERGAAAILEELRNEQND